MSGAIHNEAQYAREVDEDKVDCLPVTPRTHLLVMFGALALGGCFDMGASTVEIRSKKAGLAFSGSPTWIQRCPPFASANRQPPPRKGHSLVSLGKAGGKGLLLYGGAQTLGL